ncbi:Ltp family lipoprotein [Paratractidigestivibacter sp.]|uniref:Ltp family lipoprotein n=1 Tax=Paratractidigestivibacter sp. TaxID=2847316 RepID=UPI002ACB0B08|nr:Ltp family lipoprotein [Paratractidigestivibacter sp.]
MANYDEALNPGRTSYADEYEIVSQTDSNGVVYTLYNRQTEGTKRSAMADYYGYCADNGSGFAIVFNLGKDLTLETAKEFIATISFDSSVTSRSESKAATNNYSSKLKETMSAETNDGSGSTGETSNESAAGSGSQTAVSMANAVRMANQYLKVTAFSRNGLVKQLEYEGFGEDDATYGADNCGADWNEQAARMANKYLEITAFSRSGLIDQLVHEGFTEEQAEYGVSQTGL